MEGRCILFHTADMTPEIDICAGGKGDLTSEERQVLISRIHSLLYWLGETIPQELVVENERIPLRDMVYDYLTNEKPTEEDKAKAEVLSDELSTIADNLERHVENDRLTRGEACQMVDDIRSLLRAVDELKSSKKEDMPLKHQSLKKMIDDTKRWDKFVKQVR